jgi:RNA polymerase sigma factor (sigma-70 family)
MSSSSSIGPCGGRPRPSAPPSRSHSRCGALRRATGPGHGRAYAHPPDHHHRDALVRAHLPLADRIAASFYRRYADLVELDDLRQEARLELVRAASRAEGPRPEPYLSRCIAGALRHHLRDRALLVRLPAKRRDAAPWRHVSLDASAPGEEESRLEQLVDPVETVLCQEGADAKPLGIHLAALLSQLSPLQRSVLRLTVLEGVSMRKAAD